MCSSMITAKVQRSELYYTAAMEILDGQRIPTDELEFAENA